MALTHYNLDSKTPLDNSISNESLQVDAVGTENIIDLSITTEKLAEGLYLGDSTCQTPNRNDTSTKIVNAYHVNRQRIVVVNILGYGSTGQPANTVSVYVDKVGGLNYNAGSTTTTVEAGDILQYFAQNAGLMWHATIIAIIDSNHVRIPAQSFQSHGLITIGFTSGNIGGGFVGTIRAVK